MKLRLAGLVCLLLIPLFVLQTLWRIAADDGHLNVHNGMLNLVPVTFPQLAVTVVWWCAAITYAGSIFYGVELRKVPAFFFMTLFLTAVAGCIAAMFAWGLLHRAAVDEVTGLAIGVVQTALLIGFATFLATAGMPFAPKEDQPAPRRWLAFGLALAVVPAAVETSLVATGDYVTVQITPFTGHHPLTVGWPEGGLPVIVTREADGTNSIVDCLDLACRHLRWTSLSPMGPGRRFNPVVTPSGTVMLYGNPATVCDMRRICREAGVADLPDAAPPAVFTYGVKGGNVVNTPGGFREAAPVLVRSGGVPVTDLYLHSSTALFPRSEGEIVYDAGPEQRLVAVGAGRVLLVDSFELIVVRP